MFVCFLSTQIYDFGAKCAKASHLKLNLFLVSEIHEIHYKHVRKCVFSKGCKYLATYDADGVLRVFMVRVKMTDEVSNLSIVTMM